MKKSYFLVLLFSAFFIFTTSVTVKVTSNLSKPVSPPDPEAAEIIPTPNYIEGTLRVAIEDDFTNQRSKTRYFIQKDAKTEYEFTYSMEELKINPGSKIRIYPTITVTGGYAGSVSKVQTISTYNPAAKAISGTNRVAVLLANFNNKSVSSPTKAEVKDSMERKFTTFMAEMSFGKATFPVDVYGWVTMNRGTSCNIRLVDQPAISAADSLINYNNYKYVLIVFPNSSCPFSGVSYYPPGKSYMTDEGVKNLLVSMIPHDYIIKWGGTVEAHEIGHSLGLRHANGWDCGSSSIKGPCKSVEYGDHFDVMGGTFDFIPHYGAYNKEFLQWITSANTQVVTQSGIYSLNSIETNSAGIQSLKIPLEGSDNYLNIESRTDSGYDRSLPPNAKAGVLLKYISKDTISTIGQKTHLIDSSPNSITPNDFNDAGWEIGKTFSYFARGIKFTPISKSGGTVSADGSTTGGGTVTVDITFRKYCPKNNLKRAEVAVMLLKSSHGGIYTPPPASGTIFTDVPRSYWAASWIEQLAREGITGGCGGSNYCPDVLVTRAQMAVLLLKSKYGASYSPPQVRGSTVFSDVPLTHWAAYWINQLAAEGISGGCGTGIFCPESPVNRAQMAVFLIKTKNGGNFSPAPATGAIFADIPYPGMESFSPFIEKLYQDKITAGCKTNLGDAGSKEIVPTL